MDAPPHDRSRDEHDELPTGGLLAVGAASGLLGGLALAVPIVIWDWVRSGHRALELPMATTAWPFGLVHFSNDRNLWWPIVLGIVLLAAFWALSGIAFTALADRVYRVAHPLWAIAAGAPFRATVADPRLFTAPNWVWILGFTLSGLVIAGTYGALRRSSAVRRERRPATRTDERGTPLSPAA